MDNNELLTQIKIMFDERDKKMDARFEQMDAKFEQKFDRFKSDIAVMFEQAEERNIGRIKNLELLVKNDVGKKISTLFDGYALNREKQIELERRIDKPEDDISEIKSETA